MAAACVLLLCTLAVAALLTHPVDASACDRQLSDLLAEAQGYGAFAASGTNWKNCVKYEIRSADEAERVLLEAIDDRECVWLTFAKSMTITLTQQIRIGRSNMLIDGRGHRIVVAPNPDDVSQQPLLEVLGRNIIITAIQFRCFSQFDASNTYARCLKEQDGSTVCDQFDWAALVVSGSAKGVWIHRCSFDAHDGNSILVRDGATDVSVTWSLFFRPLRALLLRETTGSQVVSFLYNVVYQPVQCGVCCMAPASVHSMNTVLFEWSQAGNVYVNTCGGVEENSYLAPGSNDVVDNGVLCQFEGEGPGSVFPLEIKKTSPSVSSDECRPEGVHINPWRDYEYAAYYDPVDFPIQSCVARDRKTCELIPKWWRLLMSALLPVNTEACTLAFLLNDLERLGENKYVEFVRSDDFENFECDRPEAPGGRPESPTPSPSPAEDRPSRSPSPSPSPNGKEPAESPAPSRSPSPTPSPIKDGKSSGSESSSISSTGSSSSNSGDPLSTSELIIVMVSIIAFSLGVAIVLLAVIWVLKRKGVH